MTFDVAGAMELGGLAAAVTYAESPSKRYDALRAYYQRAWQNISNGSPFSWAVDVNDIDWRALMTPIEWAVWSDIREEGVVMYPQYPVAGYFVDFGHPTVRVAIECDGAEFHQDTEKDYWRQRAIEQEGWTVYRLTGSECSQRHRAQRYDSIGDEIPNEVAAVALLREIGRRHGLIPRYRKRPA